MIERTTKLTELFKKNKKTAEIFRELGLSCEFCKGISEDTVEKVAINNGLELKKFLSRLNG
jgi:hypothetical protein